MIVESSISPEVFDRHSRKQDHPSSSPYDPFQNHWVGLVTCRFRQRHKIRDRFMGDADEFAWRTVLDLAVSSDLIIRSPNKPDQAKRYLTSAPPFISGFRLGPSYSLVVEGSFPAIRLKASSAAFRTSRSLLRAATSNLRMAAFAFEPCWPRAGMAISFTVSSP